MKTHTHYDTPRHRVGHPDPLAGLRSRFSNEQLSLLGACLAWPFAIFCVLNKVFIQPNNSSPVDDFSTVWHALQRFQVGAPVYNEELWMTDPHYLYSPGGTLLLSPITLISDFDTCRILFIVFNGFAMVLAAGLLTALFNFRLTGMVWPLSVIFLFSTESAYNTLRFTNINGVLLFNLALFLFLLLRYRHKALECAAGVALGLAITIKPQFAPLLFIPFARRQFLAVASGIAVPVVLNLAAIPLMVQPGDYVDKLMPYLGIVRDYANSSIAGIGVYYGIPHWQILIWRILAVASVLIAVVFLLRWRDRDPLMWASTTSSILLMGVFLISSLGQMYYSMLILPLLFTLFSRRSVMHNPIAWIGVYLCLSSDMWQSERWIKWGQVFEYTRGTIGWSLIILSAAVATVMWTLEERSNGLNTLGDIHYFGLFGARPLPTSQQPAVVQPHNLTQPREKSTHSAGDARSPHSTRVRRSSRLSQDKRNYEQPYGRHSIPSPNNQE
ncbi:glycosyltransferase family 87 protein [Corynebacterium anserum]|uniref:DUF2029 domain-containing protein n=1 Tax=Corynebacterium anserum TaxID=2684406 RepID=A0A7G7YNL9_9CORY|nr:glycosyltransferase family 87 protein [Corynebacterium anserum]QNH96089.1 DUF2029 domain-containing protein [Corynebacterium anserum]